MKKLFVSGALVGAALFCGAANAQEMPTKTLYNYGEAVGGVSFLTAKERGETIKDENAFIRVALGRQHGAVRYAIDYTDFGSIETEHTTTIEVPSRLSPRLTDKYLVERSVEVDTNSIGLAAYYDFKNNSKITPFVGGRVAVNRISLKTDIDAKQGIFEYDVAEHKINKTNAGVGAIIGASYQYDGLTSVLVSAEYNQLGKIGNHNAKINHIGVGVGVRMEF